MVAPTGIDASFFPVAGSNRSRRPDWVTTQSDSAASFNSHGVGSVATVFTTAPFAGSIRSSLPKVASVTHTAPAAPATPQGVPCTGTFPTTSLPLAARTASGSAARRETAFTAATVSGTFAAPQLLRRTEDQMARLP